MSKIIVFCCRVLVYTRRQSRGDLWSWTATPSGRQDCSRKSILFHLFYFLQNHKIQKHMFSNNHKFITEFKFNQGVNPFVIICVYIYIYMSSPTRVWANAPNQSNKPAGFPPCRPRSARTLRIGRHITLRGPREPQTGGREKKQWRKMINIKQTEEQQMRKVKSNNPRLKCQKKST